MFDAFRQTVESLLARASVPSPWSLDAKDTAALVAAGLSVLFTLLFAARNLLPAPAARERPVRVLLKRARKAQRKGNHAEAGGLFMAARNFTEAARSFVQVPDYGRAAEACLANNDFPNAARCFERLADHQRAAELFLKAKDYLPAAENLLRAGREFEAAPLFVRGGQPLRGAECYAGAGFSQKAGEIFAREGDHGQAAPLLLRALQERLARRDSSVASEEDAAAANLADAAAESLLAGGEKLKAAQVLERGGRLARAAVLFEELGEKGRASELFIRARDTASAARVLASSDHPAEGGLRVAEALLEEGKPLEAAELFARIGEWKRAARLFFDGGLKDRAAEAFRACGDLTAAAALLVELGRAGEAAAILLGGGHAEEAARIYREMGQSDREVEALVQAGAFLLAGRSLLAQGKAQQAASALQRVEPSSPDHAEANRLLGDIFFEQEHWPLAIASYQRSIAGQPVVRENLESFYRYALALRQDGQLQGALSTLEKILLVDYHFRDAKDLVPSLKALLGASGPGQPLFAGGAGPDATLPGGGAARDQKALRYQIVEEVGRGGMGVVYKARDTLLDRVVAYKVLPPQVQRDQRVLEMFLREAKAAARLSHPNIVTIFDADQARGEYFIIMELVEGNSLKELLEKQGRFPLKSALVLAGQVLKALTYAHGRGIVHRDIKPANLLWSRSEKLLKVTDFGLARVVEEGRRTHTQMAGTPYYMAPEQILGGAVDHRADQYALGVTLYEFLTGTVPFREGDVLYHHVHTPPPPPETHNPAIPPAVSRFVMRCMEKDPERRFPDVNSAFQELRSLLAAL